jgi:ribose transport system permease protein
MRNVFYTGSNTKAAAYSGINTQGSKMSVYILASLLAAICGIISLSRFGVAVPTTGDGMEINTIAAVVIGGASLSGGEGSVVGTVLGVILLSFISNMLVLVGTSVYLQNLMSGVILLGVVTADYYNKKRLESRILI